MTYLAVGFGRAFPRSWLLPIGALTVLLGVAASGRLSRSIVADLLAWWPVWLGLAVAAVLFRHRRVGQFRVAGTIPLIALFFVGLFTWGHLAGWSLMPSASQRLVGPEADEFSEASLQAAVDGAIEVRGGSDFLYLVEPVMRGGGVGIPGASEQVADSSISVMLQAPDDPGLYTYAGWDLMLAESARWSLSLDGAVDADLSTLTVDELTVDGSGEVRLGATDVETSVKVNGSFRVIVPAGAPARVIGTAAVPVSWTLDGQGAVSPVTGSGWVITVEPDSNVTISEG